MKLEDFLKRDILNFLNALDMSTQKTSQAANDDTAFLLSSKKDVGDTVDLNSNEFDGVSLDIDLFPKESSSEVYVEPSALTSSSQQQTQPVQNVSSQNHVSNPVSSQVSSLSKTQIKALVEEELREKMSQFNSQVPSNKEVVESDHKEAIIRLKNELVDLKTIVNQLQIEKDKVISNQNKLSEELKESELHSQEIISKQDKHISEKNSFVNPVFIKEESSDNKEVPFTKEVPVNKDISGQNKTILNEKELDNDKTKNILTKDFVSKNSVSKNSVSKDSITKNLITNKSNDLSNESSKSISSSNSNLNQNVFHIKKSFPSSLESTSSPTKSFNLSSPSSSSKLLSTSVSSSLSSQESMDSSTIKKPASFKKNVLEEKKELPQVPIKIPSLVLPKRSKELPEVLFIEEELHKLRLALNNNDFDLAKKLYSLIKKRASKLTQHDEEKEVIHSQLQQVALILSFKLKGQVQSKKSFGKDLIPTKIKPAVLISPDSSSNKFFDSSSMKMYLEALTALKQKEKAKSLELLLQLNDLYPSHLGIKLRLQQALSL